MILGIKMTYAITFGGIKGDFGNAYSDDRIRVTTKIGGNG
jgi:hypothetical protein